MSSIVDDFISQVRSVPAGKMLQEIEDAYERRVRESGITKSMFMTELLKRDSVLFEETMDHLFTPINWSKMSMKTLWGIKNTGSGNLITLAFDYETETYTLRDCKNDMHYSPMLTGSEEDAIAFVTLLKEPLGSSSEVPLSVGESLIELELEEIVNPVNLEVVRVHVIA